MFDKKFLDLILLGEYLILVAVYLFLCRLTMQSAVSFSGWKLSWFLLDNSVEFRCVVCCVFSTLSLKPPDFMLVSDLPLFRFPLPVCWSCLLDLPYKSNELFSSMLRLLLTRQRSELTLKIENIIVCELFRIRLATKEVKCLSLLFLLK